MSDIWNVNIYSKFLDLRTRPARDLLSAIPLSFSPKTCYDLGCGPGNSTILLKQQFPNAKITGIDSSDNMLQKATADYPYITFSKQDISTFDPLEKIDCIFANASLQWLDNHDVLFPKLSHMLTSTGVLAIQMPNNFHSPTHQTALHVLQSHESWKPLSHDLCYGALTEPLYNTLHYYDILAKSGFKNILCWETTYFQEMDNHSAIFDWIKGTGLRPALSHMDEQNQIQFTQIYVDALHEKYPLQMNGKVLLPFRRLFLVGMK